MMYKTNKKARKVMSGSKTFQDPPKKVAFSAVPSQKVLSGPKKGKEKWSQGWLRSQNLAVPIDASRVPPQSL